MRNLKPNKLNKPNELNKLGELKKPLRLSLALISLLIIWIPSMVFADLGDIVSRFQPNITVEEEYNDNLFLSHTDRIHDFITTVSPGLRFSTLPRSTTTGLFQAVPSSPRSTTTSTLPFLGTPATEGTYGIDLNYRPGFVFYAKNPDLNYVSHAGTMNAWYYPSRGLVFRVREYLIRSEDPRENAYLVGALPGEYLLGTQRQRAIYLRNVFEPSLEYQFGRENFLSINYRNNIYDNQSPRIQDSRENFINPRLTYWFDIRNGVYLEYGLLLGRFERSPNLTTHMTTGRYIHRFNPRTSIFGEYAFLRSDFDPPSVSYDIHRPSLGIEYAFSSTLTGRVQLGYFWQIPESGSKTNGLYYNILFTQRAEKTTYTLSFLGGYTEDYFTAQNFGFTQYDRAIATVTHRLLQRLTLNLSSTLERDKLSSGERDHIWGISGNAAYQVLRWLNLALDVLHRENHSNISEREYSEYRAMIRISAMF